MDGISEYEMEVSVDAIYCAAEHPTVQKFPVRCGGVFPSTV